MNALTAWVRTVIIGTRRTPTDQQLTGHACALCARPFTPTQPRVSYGWIGLPLLRRAYACPHACTLVTVEDTETLFRTAIPTRQHVRLWHLGTDDVADMTQQQTEQLDAQPRQTVTLTHPHGPLTSRPLPVTYADQITDQARRLGYTAHTTAHQGSVTR